MLDRLKSLPLTIVLTILIWMYAESQVTSPPGTSQYVVPTVPVLISGPPELVSPYAFDVQPKTVSVTVSGPGDAVDLLRQRMITGGDSGIHAYLDIEPEDQPSTMSFRRTLRYSLPEGLSLKKAPADVIYRISKALSTTTPATRLSRAQ